ncbi:acyl carrier protein [Candidatus Pacearchaeota archaeon]|nr:acyl carrier protein [Candidatus Pacearchaeota archaeon]
MSLEKNLETETGKKFKSILIEQLKVAGLKESDIKTNSTWGDLGADYIHLAVIADKVEEMYGIEVIDEEAYKILTVGEAIDYINSKMMPNKSQ